MENEPIHNSPLSKPSPRQGSPNAESMLETIQKQKANIALLQDNITQIRAFREKRTAEIAAKKDQLERQKAETIELVSSLGLRHEASLKTLGQKHATQLATLESKPIFDTKFVQTLSVALSELRKENVQLRSKFAVAFAEVMEEIKANKLMILSVCNRMDEAPQSGSRADDELEHLQTKILTKCEQLHRCVKQLDFGQSRKAILGLSVTQCVDVNPRDEVKFASCAVEVHAPRRILSVSPFLANWAQRNAHLLSMQ
jgi:chromosome segregation ATPase